MAISEDGSSSSFEDDIRPESRVKRRRVYERGSENVEESDQSHGDAQGHEDTDLHRTEESNKREKPKSKYRIHIPKNPQIPQDSFFTQPPLTPSSPYRIGAFHWKKPSVPVPPQFPQSRHSLQLRPSASPEHATKPAVDQDPTLESGASTNQKSTTLKELPHTSEDDEFSDHVFDDVEPDQFSRPITSHPNEETPHQISPNQRQWAPASNLRQTTLFGTPAPAAETQAQNKKHNWPLANREEPPTHHKLDHEALKTWIYPINLGAIRDYQFSIVQKGLFHNILVALPTGLGKTFIAAAIMLNWFRWAPDAQIVFVAPTKPLVSQQVKACFEIAGIPRSATSMLTGATSPGIRAEEWQTKRLFFMTPQTITNDLKTGICDPKRLVLLVVDEAHRATGGYAYVEVVKFLRRFNNSFRVLALTATPGASIETVQEVIDGLGISRVEIRTEESLDIRQYVFSRKIETILFDYTEEMTMIMGLLSEALQPLVNRLTGMNAYWSKDPMVLTAYGCTIARQRWMSSDAGRKAHWGVKSMVMAIFSILASLAHGIELLKVHGIVPFFHKMQAFRNGLRDDKKASKYAKEIDESQSFQRMMSRVQAWVNAPEFVGHPKLEYLQRVVLNHFLDAGEGNREAGVSSTRIMVFSHYRDSAEQIVRVLQRNSPLVRPHVFVGQASSAGSDGMDQKAQLDMLEKFKTGLYNTLVATSIGEEGLDIGEIDLIVCYDASASPIRMLQRMGRTGRKRTGNIVVTLMRGKEENNFIKAKDNYEKMQAEIASGARFAFRDDESRRIVPKGVQPAVEKTVIDIPVENTQAGLPEPKKRARPPKRPPKKFHMPDGVRTGFTRASHIQGSSSNEGDSESSGETSQPPITIPPLNEVLLTASEEAEFNKRYLDISRDDPQVVEFPKIDKFPILQMTTRPTKYVPHGAATLRAVTLFETMTKLKVQPSMNYENNLSRQDKEMVLSQVRKRRKHRQLPLENHRSSSPGTASSQLDSLSPREDGRAVLYRGQNGPTASLSEDDFVDVGPEDLLDEQGAEESEHPSRSSPPSRGKDLGSGSSMNSNEDLPDLTTLFEKNRPPKVPDLYARRQRKRIVCDDSDEDA